MVANGTRPIAFSFAPTGTQGVSCDRNMRGSLAESLEYVCKSSRSRLAFDEPAVRRIVAGLRRGDRYPASTFAIYYELVLALSRGDHVAAESLYTELAAEQPLTERRVIALGAPELGIHNDRYISHLNTETGRPFHFLPPSHDVAAAFARRLQDGFALIQRLLPELSAEQDAMLNEIILATGKSDEEYEFDGGSSCNLWGALFLNAACHATDIAIVEVLAHEAGHSLLFGCCTREGLVNNADDELYSSPLRQDARPMDGIYHATFVSARMCWAMDRLLQSDRLTPEQRTETESRRETDRKNFAAGYETVSTYACLTDTGRSIMRMTKAYMDSID